MSFFSAGILWGTVLQRNPSPLRGESIPPHANLVPSKQALASLSWPPAYCKHWDFHDASQLASHPSSDPIKSSLCMQSDLSGLFQRERE